MTKYEEKLRNLGVRDPNALRQIAKWHREVEDLVKSNESFRDKIHRFLSGRCGMWYIVRADEIKRDGRIITLVTQVKEPPNQFTISLIGVGFPPQGCLLCPTAQLIFKGTIAQVKKKHMGILKMLKKNKTFQEISGSENWERW